MRFARFLLVLLFLPIVAVAGASSGAHADRDFGPGPDENRDRATPGSAPADTRPPQPAAAPADEGNFTVFAAAVARVPIDDFRYDELVLEGTAREVCAGRLLTGSGWAYNEIVKRFGGTPGTMYYCRERWDTANDPACNGQIGDPVANPNFRSTCWSNHARGRAIDVMVGRSGGGYNSQRGYNIVNWLLATDGNGNVNANARKLGIQQILFNDRCWNSDGDRGIASWSAMRPCGIGHYDHVHLDLTIDGSNGNVSYWGAAPRVAPKIDTQVFWDFDGGWRNAISWWHMAAHDEEGLQVPAQYDQVVVGDLDSDGIQDEIFLFDTSTGDWIIQNWNDGDSLNARVGRWGNNWDYIRMVDADGDGRVDDMFLWDRDTGNYAIVGWVANYQTRGRHTGYLTPRVDEIYPADLNGDGLLDDLVTWDLETGNVGAAHWINYQVKTHWGMARPGGWDEVIVGDWSAGGDMDEMLMWNRDNGRWQLFSFTSYRATYRRSGAWSAHVDVAAPGDYDTDGRVDDLFVYDRESGDWAIYSFHRFIEKWRISSRWAAGYDIIPVGSFMD